MDESDHTDVMADDNLLNEVLFEFRRIGNVVKVTAIHVASDTEVCIVGAPAVGDHGLKLAALRKLTYVLGQRKA
jgi:hypothetical protein